MDIPHWKSLISCIPFLHTLKCMPIHFQLVDHLIPTITTNVPTNVNVSFQQHQEADPQKLPCLGASHDGRTSMHGSLADVHQRQGWITHKTHTNVASRYANCFQENFGSTELHRCLMSLWSCLPLQWPGHQHDQDPHWAITVQRDWQAPHSKGGLGEVGSSAQGHSHRLEHILHEGWDFGEEVHRQWGYAHSSWLPHHGESEAQQESIWRPLVASTFMIKTRQLPG